MKALPSLFEGSSEPSLSTYAQNTNIPLKASIKMSTKPIPMENLAAHPYSAHKPSGENIERCIMMSEYYLG